MKLLVLHSNQYNIVWLTALASQVTSNNQCHISRNLAGTDCLLGKNLFFIYLLYLCKRWLIQILELGGWVVLVFLHTSKKACVYSECRFNSNGTLKHLLGCCTFDHVTSIITMKQIHLKLYALIWGDLILVTKGWSSVICKTRCIILC